MMMILTIMGMVDKEQDSKGCGLSRMRSLVLLNDDDKAMSVASREDHAMAVTGCDLHTILTLISRGC